MTKRRTSLSDAPLLAWGDQLRAARTRRRMLGRRAAIIASGIALLGGTMIFPPVPRLLWNASASAPIGLYAVTPGASIDVGDMVVARVPEPWRTMAARRHYIPANVPLVKRVAAGPGDEVCALGQEISINGQRVAERHIRDGRNRTMPVWYGCQRLPGKQYFLLMSGSRASFDGRYFGLTDESLLIGKARLLWAR